MLLELNPQLHDLLYGSIKECYDQDMKESVYKKIKKAVAIYSAIIDNEIIGAGFIDEKGYLNPLFVKEEYQNQGIGTNLLKNLISECKQLNVIKVDARITALSLYERFSFHRSEGKANAAFIPMELERNNYGK